MRFLRLGFLLTLMFCLKWATGQRVDMNIENFYFSIQEVEKNSNFQMMIRTKNSKVYDYYKWEMYHYDEKIISGKFDGQFTWAGYYESLKLDLNKIKYGIVDPNRISGVPGTEGTLTEYDLKAKPVSVYTSKLAAKEVLLNADSLWVYSNRDTIGTYHINSKEGKAYLLISKSKIYLLQIENVIFNSRSMYLERPVVPFDITNSRIENLVFSNVEFKDKFVIESTILPQYIQLNEIVCKNEKYQLDLNQFLITDSSQVCNLSIAKGVASQIKANYKYFKLVFDNATSVYDREKIYTEMLSMQQVNFFLDGYEKLDKEYKEFKYSNRGWFTSEIQNRIDKYWWDYGYDKFMVIVNSILVFGLFFVANLFAYKGLTKVYHPIKFKEFDERLEMSNVDIKHPIATSIKKYLKRIPVIFLYTAFVFWGLKLDLKELEIKKPFFMSLLIIQYVIGLICLAYIANYIISK